MTLRGELLVSSLRGFLLGIALAVALSSIRTPPAHADLKYGRIDAATVRLFTQRGIDVELVRARSGRAYMLAVPDAGHGSGLIVSRDGLILTARHVIEDARLIAVLLPGETKPVPAKVVYADKDYDHAFVAIPGSHNDFVPIPKKSSKLAVRDTVFVVGYPLDATRDRAQSQQGIVSGLLPDGSLQLGIALNPGNSGGPVVDANEHLLGIAVARADPRAGAQGIGIAVPIDHVLPGYKKALGSDALDEAKKTLARDASRLQSEAELIAALLTSEDSDTSFRALEGNPDAAAGSRVVADWLAKATAPSPDALALAAAEHWNRAAVLAERRASPRDELAKARRLARRASDADPGLRQRSPFVEFVLAGNEPTSVNAAVPGGTEGGTAEQAARRRLMESLETSKSLPGVRFGPTIGLWAPFQLFGGGATLKLLVANRLSLNARYQFGWHGENDELVGSHAFEALAGIQVASWNSTTTAQLVVDIENHPGLTVYHYVPGEVPTVHSLIIEAGAMSGKLNVQSTDPLSAGFDESRQVYVLEGGARYTHFYQAKSEYLTGPARSTIELSAHLLLPILNLPDDSVNSEGKSVSPSKPGAKAEIAWGKAPLATGLWEIGAGYLPAGEWYYLRVGWSYLFYP